MASKATPSHNLRSNAAPDTATAPFNLPSADVVFLTSDNIEYHLHKNILSIASPFFDDMFTLTPPSQTSTCTSSDSAVERIPVTETSNIFGGLMRLLYPVADPPLTDRLRIEQMLEAALKYQLEEATDVLRAALRLLIPQFPLQIFAAACCLRLKEEAQMAAKQWKTQASWNEDANEKIFVRTMDGASYVEEMARITAGTFFRLLQYLRDTSDNTPEFVDAPPALFRDSTALPMVTDLSDKLLQPNVALRCRDGVDVLAHEVIIRLASGHKLLTSTSVQSSPGCHVYEVDADSGPLRALLHFCYPFPTFNLHLSEYRLDAVMALAQKYEIEKVVQFIKDRFSTLTPTTRYLLAKKWGWTNEAQVAACSLLWIRGKGCAYTYTPVMESMSAALLLDMLREVFSRGLIWWPALFGASTVA